MLVQYGTLDFTILFNTLVTGLQMKNSLLANSIIFTNVLPCVLFICPVPAKINQTQTQRTS